MAVYYGINRGTKYELAATINSGGEGVVYSIAGKPGLVAKIYKPDRLTGDTRNRTKNKILAMVKAGFSSHLQGRIIVAWPEDALFDSAGVFQGFVMPRIENMKSLVWAARPSDRILLWPRGYRWRNSIAIAYNLALTVELMHKAGIVIGDMNTNNILINAKGHVTLIDSDSFNITTKTGEIYKCTVGFPEVLPPELQGKDLEKPTSVFTEKTDDFALAVHVFSLLCNNCHPFGCLSYHDEHGSSSQSTAQGNIVNGYCPYVSGATGHTAKDALNMDIFPPKLRRLFDRVFTYNVTTAVKQATIAQRPSAREWREALYELYNASFKTCGKPTHEYPASYKGGCPWCEIERKNAAFGNPATSPVTKAATVGTSKTAKNVSIPVLYCDKAGKLLRSDKITVEYGKSSTAYAVSIPGYRSVYPTSIVVSVNSAGKASENPVRFTYERIKKKKRAGKTVLLILLVLLSLFIAYCLFMFGMAKKTANDGDYSKAREYLEHIPFFSAVFSDSYDFTAAETDFKSNDYQAVQLYQNQLLYNHSTSGDVISNNRTLHFRAQAGTFPTE